MGTTPAADITVDAALVARLLTDQHPDLAGRTLRLVASGWDNALFRLGDDLCVRVPRRRVAAELVAHEQRWLPELAGRLRVPVPVPVRTGVPGDGFPWPWTVAPWFDGRPAVDLPPADRAGLAAGLAGFLTDLHRPAPPHAPPNPVRGVPLAHRDALLREQLAGGTVPRAAELAALWDDLLPAPPWPADRPVWVHGDPHPGNLLVGPDGGLAAVLDFGDITAGDPATDLATGWLTLDAPARAEFRDRLDPDPDTWRRARGWALAIGVALAVHSDDNPAMASVARHGLAQVLLPD